MMSNLTSETVIIVPSRGQFQGWQLSLAAWSGVDFDSLDARLEQLEEEAGFDDEDAGYGDLSDRLAALEEAGLSPDYIVRHLADTSQATWANPRDEVLLVRNLTPHEINIRYGNDEITIFPSGYCPRVLMPEVTEQQTRIVTEQGDKATVPVADVTSGRMRLDPPLPAPAPGVRLVVSRLVAAAAPERGDLLVPDKLVRDRLGHVVGCERLAVPTGV